MVILSPLIIHKYNTKYPAVSLGFLLGRDGQKNFEACFPRYLTLLPNTPKSRSSCWHCLSRNIVSSCGLGKKERGTCLDIDLFQKPFVHLDIFHQYNGLLQQIHLFEFPHISKVRHCSRIIIVSSLVVLNFKSLIIENWYETNNNSVAFLNLSEILSGKYLMQNPRKKVSLFFICNCTMERA